MRTTCFPSSTLLWLYEDTRIIKTDFYSDQPKQTNPARFSNDVVKHEALLMVFCVRHPMRGAHATANPSVAQGMASIVGDKIAFFLWHGRLDLPAVSSDNTFENNVDVTFPTDYNVSEQPLEEDDGAVATQSHPRTQASTTNVPCKSAKGQPKGLRLNVARYSKPSVL